MSIPSSPLPRSSELDDPSNVGVVDSGKLSLCLGKIAAISAAGSLSACAYDLGLKSGKLVTSPNKSDAAEAAPAAVEAPESTEPAEPTLEEKLRNAQDGLEVASNFFLQVRELCATLVNEILNSSHTRSRTGEPLVRGSNNGGSVDTSWRGSVESALSVVSAKHDVLVSFQSSITAMKQAKQVLWGEIEDLANNRQNLIDELLSMGVVEALFGGRVTTSVPSQTMKPSHLIAFGKFSNLSSAVNSPVQESRDDTSSVSGYSMQMTENAESGESGASLSTSSSVSTGTVKKSSGAFSKLGGVVSKFGLRKKASAERNCNISNSNYSPSSPSVSITEFSEAAGTDLNFDKNTTEVSLINRLSTNVSTSGSSVSNDGTDNAQEIAGISRSKALNRKSLSQTLMEDEIPSPSPSCTSHGMPPSSPDAISTRDLKASGARGFLSSISRKSSTSEKLNSCSSPTAAAFSPSESIKSKHSSQVTRNSSDCSALPRSIGFLGGAFVGSKDSADDVSVEDSMGSKTPTALAAEGESSPNANITARSQPCHGNCLARLEYALRESRKRGNKIFGTSLVSHLARSMTKVPIVLYECISQLEREDALRMEEGIYRRAGPHISIERMVEEFECARIPRFTGEFSDPAVVTSVVKRYLRDLPEPLITFNAYEILRASAGKDRKTKLDPLEVRRVLGTMPKAHWATLAYLITHLHDVASYVSHNKMTASNLCVVFGPSLMRPRNEMFGFDHFSNELVCFMIENYDVLFGSEVFYLMITGESDDSEPCSCHVKDERGVEGNKCGANIAAVKATARVASKIKEEPMNFLQALDFLDELAEND